MNFCTVGRSIPPIRLLHELAGPLDDSRDARLADEHVVRFLRQHEPGRAGQRIERAFRERQQLRFAVAIREHREHEEIEPVVDRLVEGVENARLVAVAALPSEQLLGLVAAVPSEIRVQEVDHRPEVTSLFDVDLKQIPKIVQAWTALPQPALLLDARRFGVSLRDDQPAELVSKLSGHFLPDRLAEEVPEADPTVVDRFGKEDAPAILGQLHVLEVRPPRGVHADRRPHVHLMEILEPLRAHVPPPLDVGRLPMFECALEPLVARQADVVGNLFGGNHNQLPPSRFQLPVPA
jgi:hypothetical protein